MQLHYHPYACSLAPLIAARHAGLDLDLVFVDIMTEPHRLADGAAYTTLNVKDYVPALVRDDGTMLTELAVILQYLGDLTPDSGLVPAGGTEERLRQNEWLNFIATELHKFFSPCLFHPEVGAAAQDFARGKIAKRFAHIDVQLGRTEYVTGPTFSAADAYLFVMVNWAPGAAVSLEPYSNLRAWFDRMKATPAVREALRLHSRMPAAAAA